MAQLNDPFDNEVEDTKAIAFYEAFLFNEDRPLDPEFWTVVLPEVSTRKMFPGIYARHFHYANHPKIVFSMTPDFLNDEDFEKYGTYLNTDRNPAYYAALQRMTTAAQRVRYERPFVVNENTNQANDALLILGAFISGNGPEYVVFPEGHPTTREVLDETNVVKLAMEKYLADVELGEADRLIEENNGYYVCRYSVLENKLDAMDDLLLFPLEYHKIRTLLGSCTVVLEPMGPTTVSIGVFNSTSAYSGDLEKELWNAAAPELQKESFEAVNFGSLSISRSQVGNVPYTNVGQEYIIGSISTNYFAK